MKKTIHVALISTQTVPNISPILDQRFKPDHVVMVVSKSMQKQADRLEQIFKPRGISASRWPIDDAWDIEHIRDRMMDLLIEYEFENIALNATCGTKPMSIAAYEVFRAVNKPIFYIHPEKDRLIWMHPKDQPTVDLADRIKLKEYLQAYGASHVNEGYKGGVFPQLRDLVNELVDNIGVYSPVLPSINYLASRADNPQFLSSGIDAESNKKHAFGQLVELFEQAGLLKRKKSQLKFFDEESRFFVNGGWLEVYAYACCLNIKKTMGIQDIARSVEIERQHGSQSVLNEMDVAFLKDNRLYLLECKTKKFKGSDGSEVMYKLDSLRDLLGGLQAKAMLVSFQPLKAHHINRAKELNIKTCCHEDLPFLQEKIAQWIG